MPSDSKREWRESTLDPVLNRFGERQDRFETGSGIAEDILYTREDRDGSDYDQDIGYPGEYPYTRGVQPTMYRGRLWTMRQYAGLASPEESNRRYRYLLEQGQTGLSVAFDLPTQTGYDSDHPMAQGEIGRTGVPISSLADMETLFEGIPLDKVSTSMTINAYRVHSAGAVHSGRQEAGRRRGEAERDDTERHPERVHSAGDVHLSSKTVHAAGHGQLRVLFGERAALEPPSASAATTWRRPGRRRRRNSPSRSRTLSRTSRRRWTRAWRWTPSRPG